MKFSHKYHPLCRKRFSSKMKPFRDENRYLIYYVGGVGLYMKSIEVMTSNKWIIAFYTIWSKIPLTVFPIYIGWDLRSLLFEKAPLLEKIAMGRKIIAFSGFYIKNIMFYMYRHKIEDLIDLWDNSFQKDFYTEARKIREEKSNKENYFVVRISLFLAFLASLAYSTPGFFSKTKDLPHPTGIIYPRVSPVYELIVFFDLLCAMSGISSPGFDSILIVFLSNVRCKLNFLRDALTDMVNALVIDNEGRLMARQTGGLEKQDGNLKLGKNEEVAIEGKYEEINQKDEAFERNIQEFEGKLRIWILYHQQLIGFFDETRKVYAPVATVELIYIVMYTALTAVHLVQVKPGLVALGIILVACSNLMSIFLWSTLGADVGGIHLFRDAFSRAWFLFPKKIQTAFSFVIMRCEKPLYLYGISIYKINLVTFFEILKLTYQFFAFMLQLTD